MRYAVLDENNVVTNIIVCETLEEAQAVTKKTCVFVEPGVKAEIGDLYNGIAFPQVVEVKE